MWAGACTVKIGRIHIGVRCSDERVLAGLRRVLARHIVPDVDAPANYSVSLGRKRPTSPLITDLHSLYRSTGAVIRTRNARRVVDGLLSYLSTHVDRREGEPLRVVGLAFVSEDGTALLAPPGSRRLLASCERRINRLGLSTVDAPWTGLDLETGELVVSGTTLDVDAATLSDLYEQLGNGEGSGRIVEPGRYRLRGWALAADPKRGPMAGAAGALAPALSLVLDRAEPDARHVLDATSRLLAGIAVTTLVDGSAGVLVSSLEQLMQH